MNHDTSLSHTQAVTNLYEPAPLHATTRHAIDHSLRVPLVLLFRTSTFWLVIGAFLSLICAFKLVLPSFLDGSSFLNYGRLFPVACDLLIYGWATPAALAVSLWLMARLCGTPLKCNRILTCAALLWNLGVFFGSLAVLAGYSTSVTFLEYPAWASFILFISFLLMAVWGVLFFSVRQPRALYVSQWYLLAALCSFPWIYGTANFFLTWGNFQGSAQGPIHWWYGSNLMTLWFAPVAIAASYYLIPKLTGVTIYSYYLALFGFFSQLLFAGWGGMTYLLGGPIPAWMGSVSVVATILMILPMLAVVINFYKMLQGHSSICCQSPALRFVVVGIISYISATLLSALNAFPTCNAILHFTDFTFGMIMVSLLGFFGMTVFGVIYYLMPRLVNVHWPVTSLISSHFWFATIGITLMVSSCFLGGLTEGIALEDPVVTFINIISFAAPWRWLIGISWILLFVGCISFVRLLIMMRWRMVKDSLPSPLLSTEPHS